MELVTVDFDRRLRVPIDRVQRALVGAFKEHGFKIVRSQAGLLEARRGSQLKAAVGIADSLPLRAQVSMSGHDGSSWVRCHLGEAERVVNDVTATARQYANVFWEVQQGIDEALGRLDPDAVGSWPDASFVVRQAQAFVDQTREGMVGAAAHLPGGQGIVPAGAIVFRRSDGCTATFDADDFSAQRTVLGLIESKPGALPENLAVQLEEFAVKIERSVGSVGPAAGAVVEISDDERRIVEFLQQQVELRKRLPVREVYRCRECRFEKIVNPDLKRLQARNRRWRALTGLAGIGVTPAGINVFLLVGRLFNMRQLDPDYMCPRCQGLEADQSLATICPGCGTIRKEAVLRKCPGEGCGFDFRTLLDVHPRAVWHERPPAPMAPTPTPVGAGPAAGGPPAGWYVDPYHVFEQRWWDGAGWTAWVTTGGVVGVDPRIVASAQQSGQV